MRQALLYQGKLYAPGDKVFILDNEYLAKLVQNGVVIAFDNGAAKTVEEMTVAELKALLSEKGLEHKSGANKADLIALLKGDS